MTRAALRAALAAIFTCSAPRQAAADNACEREMARAARSYGVPLGVLYAVGLTETGRGDSLRPYALNIEGKSVYDIDKDEALRRFQRGAAGRRQDDRRRLHADQPPLPRPSFSSVEDMLDPSKNVDYAARFLQQLKAREGSWTLAVARYHAGPDNDPAQKRYVCRVIANLVASGFGAWTADARAFCQP